MSTFGRTGLVQALTLGFFSALVGFCYATSSAPESRAVPGVSPASRAIGESPLRFLNPFDPNTNEFDLGDATVGSAITRYISATGGIPAYRFSTGDLVPPTIGAGSTLTLSASGLLTGTISQTTPLPQLGFNVTVADSTGITNRTQTGRFRINLSVGGAQIFRFATDRLNNGVLGVSYISKLEVLGAKGDARFTVVPGSLTVNDVTKGVGGLEAIGLSLAEDGTVSGRPLEVGVISFTARATDALNRTALDRTNTVTDQVVTFAVEDNRNVASFYSTLACSVRGEIGKLNKDSVTLNGLINVGVAPLSAGNGTRIGVHIGGAAFDGFINLRGQVVNQRGGPLVFADGSTMTGTIDYVSGQFKISIRNASLATAVDAPNLPHRATRRLGVSLVLGSSITGSDLLEFATTHVGDRFGLEYRLGKIGSLLGGAFQVLDVRGKDAFNIAGVEGTAWAAKFLAVPRFGIDENPSLRDINQVNVRIGTNFNQTIPSSQLVSNRAGNVQLIKPTSKGELVNKFTLNVGKFEGFVSTNALATDVTGLPQAQTGTTPLAFFNLGIGIDRSGTNADFSGEGARQIKSIQHSHQWADNDQAQ